MKLMGIRNVKEADRCQSVILFTILINQSIFVSQLGHLRVNSIFRTDEVFKMRN